MAAGRRTDVSAPHIAQADDSPQARMIAAMQLHVQGQAEAARLAYESLLEEFPGQPEILHSLGMLYTQMQQWEKAAEYLGKAATSHPGQPRTLLPLARAQAQSGRIEQAMEALVRLLAADPNHAEALNFLYDLCLASGAINRLIAANPKLLTLRAIAIKLCQAQGDEAGELEQLAALYRHGIRDTSIMLDYGKLLWINGKFERCLELCREMLAAAPGSVDVLKLRANTFMALGKNAEALAVWREIVARVPDDHKARATIGMIRLLMSDGKEGFEEYGAHSNCAVDIHGLTGAMPQWDGRDAAGKRLLLWCSEGIGDVVMFASLFPWLLAQGAGVTMAVYPKLVALFSRSFPEARIVVHTPNIFNDYAAQCDAQISFGELMRHALPHYTPAEHPPFLKADNEKVKQLREKYRAVGKKLVGISWHTTNKNTSCWRSIPLEQWQPLFDLPEVQLISLQYGDHAAEIDAINHKRPGTIMVDPDIDIYNDIDGFAAQMMAVDEIISIQNSTVHLAGALGVKTTLLLNAASEWRWGLTRIDNRWYKSVQIERQETLFEWDSVIKRVYGRL